MTQENGSFTELMAKIAKENEEFLAGKGRGVYSEVVELASDAIDYIKFATERKEAVGDYVKHPMFFFICSILMPLSNGMYSDLLIGNLPACFMGLRLMLESLAKCYIAESHPDKDSFFEAKLLTLENFLKGERISTSELLKYYGEMTGLKDEPVKLWGKISEG
jgi:hypothetical protein